MKNVTLYLFFCISCNLAFGQNLFPYLKNDQYGFCDAQGKVVIAPQYQEVSIFDNKGFASVRKDTLWSLIDISGHLYMPFEGTSKWIIEPMVNILEKEKHKREKHKIVKRFFVAYNEKDYYHFWIVNSQKKHSKKSSNDFYNYMYKANFSDNYLITIDDNNLQSVFDTLGNVLLDKVTNIRLLNRRFFSYKEQNLSKLYDTKVKKTFLMPYRNIEGTKNDTCFIVSNALEDSRGFRLKDTMKIVNQHHDIFFMGYMSNLAAISPSHYYHYREHRNRNIDSTIFIKIKNGKAQINKYKYIKNFDNQRIALSENGITRIIDFEDNVIFEGKYDEIWSPSYFSDVRPKSYYHFNKGKDAGILDSTFKVVFQFEANDVDKTEFSDFYVFYRNRQDGIVNHEGKIIIPAQYYDINVLDKQFFKVKIRKRNHVEKVGLFSLMGKMLLKPIYNEIETLKYKDKTYVKAQVGKSYVYFDENGTKMSDSAFKSFSAYTSNEPIYIKREPDPSDSTTIYDRFGNVLETNNVPISLQKVIVRSDSSVFYLITKGDYTKEMFSMLYDSEGKSICNKNQTVSSRFDRQDLIYGLFVIQENGQEKVINHKNKEIVPFDNQRVIEINPQYIVIKRQAQYFFYTHTGKQINTEGYDKIEYSGYQKQPRYVAFNIPNKTFQEKRQSYYTTKDTVVTSNYRNYGFVNHYGTLVIPMIYNTEPNTSDKLLCTGQGFEDGNKTSFILDTLGNVLLKTNDDDLKIINRNDDPQKVIFEATKDSVARLININGKEISTMRYKSISSWYGVLFYVEDGNTEKIVNLRNEFVAKGEDKRRDIDMGTDFDMDFDLYSKIPIKNRIYVLRLKEKTLLINLQGDIIKTFDTTEVTYVFGQKQGLQAFYSNIEDNPLYINRNLLKIMKDNKTWYYNLETLKEYRN